MTDITRAFVERSMAHAAFKLHLGIDTPDGVNALSEVTFAPVECGMRFPDPSLLLSKDAVQSMMDDLWTAGIRPTRNQDHAGEVDFLREQLGRIIGREWSD